MSAEAEKCNAVQGCYDNPGARCWTRWAHGPKLWCRDCKHDAAVAMSSDERIRVGVWVVDGEFFTSPSKLFADVLKRAAEQEVTESGH